MKYNLSENNYYSEEKSKPTYGKLVIGVDEMDCYLGALQEYMQKIEEYYLSLTETQKYENMGYVMSSAVCSEVVEKLRINQIKNKKYSYKAKSNDLVLLAFWLQFAFYTDNQVVASRIFTQLKMP